MAGLQYFFVENPRTARRFISSLNTGQQIRQLTLFKLDKNTKAESLAADFARIPAGEDAGVLSEAGCPGVADPGALAVEWAHQHNAEVVPLSGPSSILLALMGSGFSGQQFAFHGYPPIETQQRQKYLRQLEQYSAKYRQTQILIETPYRNNSLLADVLKTCQPQTRLCIAADVTAPEQLIKTLAVATWQKQVPDLHKRPVVFLLMA